LKPDTNNKEKRNEAYQETKTRLARLSKRTGKGK
jgi:hypothetical protein